MNSDLEQLLSVGPYPNLMGYHPLQVQIQQAGYFWPPMGDLTGSGFMRNSQQQQGATNSTKGNQQVVAAVQPQQVIIFHKKSMQTIYFLAF
jgi:hypothetical protein